MEKPETANSITSRSTSDAFFHAASTPSGTPTPTLMSMAKSVSPMVASVRWRISVDTGRPEKIDVPRSPRTMRPSQMPTCVTKGSFRPSLARMRAMSSDVA